MRHLTRLYFENTTATEQFVSLVDQGVERVDQGNNEPIFIPLYNIRVGSVSKPMTLAEAIDALLFLQATPCFFKLPIGAHAIVDIYIPDVIGSAAPKVFDYQVYKAKNSEHNKDHARDMAKFHESLSKIPAEVFDVAGSTAYKPEGTTGKPKGTTGPAGPISATGPTGPTSPTASICCYSSSGPSGPMNPCGGQTSIPCPNPITTRASCLNGMLVCVSSLLGPRDGDQE